MTPKGLIRRKTNQLSDNNGNLFQRNVHTDIMDDDEYHLEEPRKNCMKVSQEYQ